MAKQWFYLKGEEQVGPVDWEALASLFKKGEIKPSDLVWGEGLPEWKPAAEIAGLVPPAPEEKMAAAKESEAEKPTGPPKPPRGTPDRAGPPKPARKPAGSPGPPPPAGQQQAPGPAAPPASGQEQGFNLNPFLQKLSDTAKATASTIGAKSAELAQSGKSRLEINQINAKIKDKKAEIGDHTYQAFLAGSKPDEETLNSFNYEIKGYLDRIYELESQIQAAEAQQHQQTGSVGCASCGQALAPGAKFCAGCGAPTGQ